MVARVFPPQSLLNYLRLKMSSDFWDQLLPKILPLCGDSRFHLRRQALSDYTTKTFPQKFAASSTVGLAPNSAWNAQKLLWAYETKSTFVKRQTCCSKNSQSHPKLKFYWRQGRFYKGARFIEVGNYQRCLMHWNLHIGRGILFRVLESSVNSRLVENAIL